MRVNDTAIRMWETVKNNEKYCMEKHTERTAGGYILGMMPYTYNGIDCFLLIDDDEYCELVLNRLTDFGEAPLYDDYKVIQFAPNETIPAEFVKPLRELMENKLKFWGGEEYRAELMARAKDEIYLWDIISDINKPKKATEHLKCPTCGRMFKKAKRCPECGQLIGFGRWDGDNYISANGNIYWTAQLNGWTEEKGKTFDVVGIFSTRTIDDDEESRFFDKMITYSCGATIKDMETEVRNFLANAVEEQEEQ